MEDRYSPAEVENKWYSFWLENKFFHSTPDEREAYCVVIPPPNITGILHMGHMLNNTIQDVLVRKARMCGKNACWVPGTDHASIATEAKVVAKLTAEGIDKKNLDRETFLKHAWEWKEKHGGIILSQLKKLGASCDWDRTAFTLDEGCYESVINVFIDLYNKGLIYRGVRMVNWDPKALTALSDEEVIHKEVNSKLYYLRYKVSGSNECVVVATTRPETILGDTAVCVHSDDERYKHLHGKKVIIPIVNKEIPIIVDDYVDIEFGTGCLKITPAHDINDYELGLKHKLDSINIFNDNGSLNDNGGVYAQMDRFDVRTKIVKDLVVANLLEKQEDYTNKVGYSERTDVVIEPKLSAQWFLKMKGLAKPALDVVMDDTVKFHPAKFKNTYRHWMENVKDWCISRQLWWGQRIPAFYLPNKEVVVARTAEEALEIAKQKFTEAKNYSISDLRQDEDVLDTWFSSWLWPISVFDGVRYPENKEINYYYPTCDLVTAPEIMFFWVARMIIAGLEYRKEIPFKNVYFTGIVRDKLGRKMSKSLGNSPDPLDLIEKYGADGVRVGMLLTSPAGNDLPFDEALCEQGRNFSNKIWNALRLIRGWKVDESIEQPDAAGVASLWFKSKLSSDINLLNDFYSKYRLSDALMTAYKLVWDDFCSWYLEMIKPAYGSPIDVKTKEEAIGFMRELVKLLHPFMPFISEEIWSILNSEKEPTASLGTRTIMFEPMPKADVVEVEILNKFEYAKEVVIAMRSLRNEKNIQNKLPLQLSIRKNAKQKVDTLFDAIVKKLCNIDSLEYTDTVVEAAISFVIKSTEFFVHMNSGIDVGVEIEKAQKELDYTAGFLNSVMKKLGNAKFVDGAPLAVVESERRKQTDAQQKIEVLKAQIEQLEKMR